MRIRLQADADLNPALAEATRRRHPEIEFATARDSGLEGLPDEEVLRIAAAAGRLLVTHDRHTMRRTLSELILEGFESPGVLVVIPQHASWSKVIDTLAIICFASEPSEWLNRVVKIPF